MALDGGHPLGSVLEGGGIIEAGSHRALIERGGRYAEMFELQAAGYR